MHPHRFRLLTESKTPQELNLSVIDLNSYDLSVLGHYNWALRRSAAAASKQNVLLRLRLKLAMD